MSTVEELEKEIISLKKENKLYSSQITYINDKLKKEIMRQSKIIYMSDKRQKRYLDKITQSKSDISGLKMQNGALLKEMERHNKILSRSDKIQKRSYDALLIKYEEVQNLKNEIQSTQSEILFTLGNVCESRSKETANHVSRVALYSELLAKNIGLNKEHTDLIKRASPMHDIGKVAIPDSILKKPGKLTDEEREVMDTHVSQGYDLLKSSTKPLIKTAALIAHEHHEKWDGSGYPRGLKGEEISIEGRITALADVYDALGSDRCYKMAWEDSRIYKLLTEESGKHFDPDLINIFFNKLSEFLAIRDKYKD
jgi:response regulator RpfG family c-di-GMP phosphodiesterase